MDLITEVQLKDKYDITNLNEDNLELCEICFDRFQNKNIFCSTSKKSICNNCYSLNKPVESSVYPPTTEAVSRNTYLCKDNELHYVFKCNFCRCITDKRMEDLQKEDILNFYKINFINYYDTDSKFDDLHKHYWKSIAPMRRDINSERMKGLKLFF